MEESLILGVLKLWNPWEKEIDYGILRNKYVDFIYKFMDNKEILLLKGIRRSGKTIIIKQLIKELIKKGIDKKQILYINLEDYNFANNLNVQLFAEIFTAYKNYSKNTKKSYIFIDEVQKVDGWERWIRTYYDREENIKFILTGSSASLLSKELSTLLTGRNISFTIMPLSFIEFCEFSKNPTIEEYMKFGGFPEIVLNESEEKKRILLEQYFTDIINRDIIDRYNIRNAKQIIEIARYLISTAGSKISLNKLSKVFGISRDSLALYISYMIDAYLLYEVAYFSYSAKIRYDVTKLPKLYVLDNGLINIVNIKYSENIGKMFENTVLIKLLEKNKEIQYWSELKSEVDFIVDKKAINVTSADKIPERETNGLENFQKKHKDFSTLLITKSTTKDNIISILDFLKN